MNRLVSSSGLVEKKIVREYLADFGKMVVSLATIQAQAKVNTLTNNTAIWLIDV